ncbi:hypothetical protein IPH25_01305 [bacterium]|nr:MAG: hypothetical protein IPG37_03430 [bacterium]QQR62064.1 MAG: hypothetical protein IPH25_01305 [bacterium]QQR62342.1 MAG: hypothetical protein IPH67_02830 [bacterium]
MKKISYNIVFSFLSLLIGATIQNCVGKSLQDYKGGKQLWLIEAVFNTLNYDLDSSSAIQRLGARILHYHRMIKDEQKLIENLAGIEKQKKEVKVESLKKLVSHATNEVLKKLKEKKHAVTMHIKEAEDTSIWSVEKLEEHSKKADKLQTRVLFDYTAFQVTDPECDKEIKETNLLIVHLLNIVSEKHFKRHVILFASLGAACVSAAFYALYQRMYPKKVSTKKVAAELDQTADQVKTGQNEAP